MRRLVRLAAAGLIAVSASVAAQAPRPALLQKVLPGNWTLHEIGTSSGNRAVCVKEPGMLLQLHHANASCARLVVAETARDATVQYTCTGQGHGRTKITVETPSLIRIQTQGLAHGAPFDMDYEARRAGSCA